MQRRTLTLALVTTLVLGTWSLSAQAVELQQPAPAFTAQDAHGKPISLSDHSGKIVVLPPQGAIGKQYGARTTPHIFIVDAQGRLAYKGGIDSIPSSRIEDIARAEPHVKNALQALTSGQKVAQASTQPHGCSVKYGS